MRYRDIILASALGKGKKGMAVGWPLMLGIAGGAETTVTGVSPLLLAAALHKPIKSLTQYGLCSQSGTPTPSSPVDIMCNNGALTMVDNELPTGYKRVLGYSMNNNSYWEIDDFPLYGSDTLRFAFEATDACNVIGAYSGSASGNNYSLYVGTNANYLRYKSAAYNSAVDYDTRYDVEITPTGTSGMKTDSTWTAQSFTTQTNLCIGTTATSASSAKLKGKLYGNIEVVGRAKFVPCERVSDNALGYYDTIGEAFYEQASGYSGATSLGYDGSHYSLAVVGTDEVISLTASGADTQTAGAENLFAVGDYADTQDIISGAITRKVGVWVLTGEENWTVASTNTDVYYLPSSYIPDDYGVVSRFTPICSHLEGVMSTVSISAMTANTIKTNNSSKIVYACVGATYTTKEAWKAFVAAQYAAGTPIIIIYPLATETTESATPQELHTNKGDNTIIVTANVSPIQLEAVYTKGE